MCDPARRSSDEQPFLARQTPRHAERVAVADRAIVVDDRQIECLGKLVLSYALDLVRRTLHSVLPLAPPELRQNRPLWVAGNDLDGGIFLLEIAADASDRPTGSRGSNHMGDAALRLLPGLRAGRRVVRVRIRLIVKLIREHRVGRFFRNALGLPY